MAQYFTYFIVAHWFGKTTSELKIEVTFIQDKNDGTNPHMN